MIPAAFEYSRPGSVEETLGLLGDHGPGARVIAGGQSLLPLMKLRLARPERLIDIGRLDDLRGIRRQADGRLLIGALTTYDELLRDPTITSLALMADVLPIIADLQVRNRGTIGGAIAHADPASDMPAVLLALEAELIVRSRKRERTIPMTEFIRGPFETALEPDELLIEIRLPAPSGNYGSAYQVMEQPASGYAIAGAAVVIGRTGGEGMPIDDVRIALTGVGEHPYRATAAEASFRESGDASAAAVRATDGQTVSSDIHADREYRTAIAGVQVRRALGAAIARLG
jgi:aerobic carbon-monoxide dehydrogenase medium subunit